MLEISYVSGNDTLQYATNSNAVGGGSESLPSVHRPITLRRDTRRARYKDYIKSPPFKGSFLAITKFKLDSELQSFRFDILFVVCVGISVGVALDDTVPFPALHCALLSLTLCSISKRLWGLRGGSD